MQLAPVELTFDGVGIMHGDKAKWVPHQLGCSASLRVSPFTSVQVVGGVAKGSFRFVFGGAYYLCYRFMYSQQIVAGAVPPSPWVPFKDIRAVAVGVTGADINGTALGCVSNVTILGAGFSSLAFLTSPPTLTCTFGTSVVTPSSVSDDRMNCLTPAYTAVATLALKVQVGSALAFTAVSTFHAYDSSAVVMSSVFPAGGAYNVVDDRIYISGTMLNFGQPRCRFGPESAGLIGDVGEYFNTSMTRCVKPRFPDSYRDALGSYVVAFTPNGQCYGASTGTFTTYNALTEGTLLKGSPSTQSVSLRITGEGYVNIPGGRCRFTQIGVESPTTFTKPLTVESATVAKCSSPAAGVADAKFAVSVSINGRSVEPNKFAGVDVVFTEYDLSRVRVSHIEPPGGPTGVATAVTLVGSGFALYGEGQLQCKANGILVPGMLLDSTKVLCTVPSEAVSSVGSAPITISLNNGTAGTFSGDQVGFRVYPTPVLNSIVPNKGDSNGGTVVTVVGSGFTQMYPGNSARDYLYRTRLLKCSFGAQVQALEPAFHNDTHIVCTTTWGDESPNGLLVGIALNAQSFVTDNDVRFSFVGLHKPALVEVYFPPEATTLVIQFDEQPSNRANMKGVSPCSMVLAPDTVAVLQGSASAEPNCFWPDDTKLVAYLTMFTNAGPGIVVNIKPNVLWPKTWKYPPEGCNGPNTMCAGAGEAVTMTVDPFFPCDRLATIEREPCVQPVSLIQAPDKISSCPGTALSLDGTRSSGGGIKPLVYTWAAHPTKSDNYYQISSSMVGQGSVEKAALSTELDGGRTYVFLLYVTNFLGSVSANYEISILRDSMPIPTISIEAPPLFTFRASSKVALQAKATLASCFSSGSGTKINFVWTLVSVGLLSTASGSEDTSHTLDLSGDGAKRRDLELNGKDLKPGLKYKLQVKGCMATSSDVCGAATVDVGLVDEPLRSNIAGGDRNVGEDDKLILTACADTFDPDDPTASLRFFWSCEYTIAAVDAGDPILIGDAPPPPPPPAACTVIPPAVTSCGWAIGKQSAAGALSPGYYTFRLSATKATGGDMVNSSVAVAVESGVLPTVSIASLAFAKQNANRKLVLEGTAAIADTTDPVTGDTIPATGTIDSYSWSISDPTLDLATASATGTSQKNLVMLPNVLSAGNVYTFTLTATTISELTGTPRSAFSTSEVTMNRAPYGGSLILSGFTVPARALETDVTLSAVQWFDDDPADYPLSYSFAYGLTGSDESSYTTAGKRSFAASTTLLKPPEGNFTVVCYVYDSFLAFSKATTTLSVLAAAPIGADSKARLNGDIQKSIDEGNTDGSSQIVTAVSETMNKPADGRRLQAADGIDKGAFREELMDFVVSTSGSASADPLATKQQADVVKSLAAKADELNTGTMDKGASLVDGLIATSAGGGGEMADGAAASMLTSLGSMFQGTNAAAAEARRRIRMRRLQEVGGNTTNGTNASDATDPALALAISRADKLRNSTASLTGVLGQTMAVGEEPVSVISPSLSMRVGKADPCDLESKPFSAPGAAAGGFSLPAGTNCKSARRRLKAERRARQLEEASRASDPVSAMRRVLQSAANDVAEDGGA